jgi:hypothetical protein
MKRVAVPKLRFDIEPQTDILIVVTHSCDLLHSSYGTEPTFEVLKATPLCSEDGNYTYGKNPRKFHFQLKRNGSTCAYEISIHQRCFLERPLLEEYDPDHGTKIESTVVETIARWLAQRYRRSAFPDEFNLRWQGERDRIKQILKRGGKLFTGIYLRLDSTDELESDKEYRIVVIATAKPEDLGHDTPEGEMYVTLDRLEETLNKCTGISVVYSDVRSEADFSMDDLRHSMKWDFDHMTFSEKPGGDLVPDA